MSTILESTPHSAGFRLAQLARDVQPVWYYLVIGNLALMAFCIAAAGIDPRLLHGVSVWTKPAKFALSLAVYFATLMCFVRYLPHGYLKTLGGRLLVQVTAWCAVLEMLYITAQAALGEASHFNTGTPFHALMYSLMGLGATLLVLALAWMGWVIGRANRLDNHLVLAVVVGLFLTFVLGGGFGGYLGSMSQHWVGGVASDANGIVLFNWARDGGDLRVAHFWGMHAMQFIPLLALCLPAQLSNAWKLAGVMAGSAAYAAFATFTFYQALEGLPFIS